jgi:hypothetical protein
MDEYSGAQLFTDITKQNIVPVTESVVDVSLTALHALETLTFCGLLYYNS